MAFNGQQDQQWDRVVFQKKGVRGPSTSKTAHLNAQKRAGKVVSQRKRVGKTNNAAVAMADRVGGEQNMCKLEEGGEETFRHAKVGKGLQTAIALARTAKGMTQKQLATALNVKTSMVADYEAGRAIPNPQFLIRIERKLGCKLPRGKKQRTAVLGANVVVAAKGKKKKKGPVVVNLMKGLRISK
ncbi:MAG: hypothetical protein CL450_09155 [Acidimicrobiaceae bacterium]|nr:hypothetical protein [Acidimicrobiaceae bacterium]|tara:strand:- start:330 stop:884 length:555 start_codon:yes stop_codon:yes gene_type:complete